MPTEIKKEIALEIAHVLFIDIVGYSKLLIDEQRDYLHTLNEVEWLEHVVEWQEHVNV
jgi:hypothetical protein